MSWLNAIAKLILGITLGVSVAALTAFNILLAWVATGPRNIDVVSPYIELAFEPPDHKYSISVGETWLIWDGWKHPIDIRLRSVKIFTSERHTYSKFPEISLGLDVFALVSGHVLPTSLTITHPVIGLFQNEDRSISFGLEPEPAMPAPEAATPAPDTAAASPQPAEVPAVPFAAIMTPFITPDENSPLRELRLVSIVNADLTLGNKSKGMFFKTSGADFTFKRNHDGLHAYANAKIAYENYQSLVTAEITKKNKTSVVEGDVSVQDVMPGALADLFSDNSLLSAMKLPVTGRIRLVEDMDNAAQKLDFDVDGGKGSIDSDKLDGSLPVNELHVQGRLDHNVAAKTDTLDVKQLHADLGGTMIDGNGTVALKDNDPEIHAKLVAKNVAAKDVRVFWPPKLAPLTRDWVVSNITDGTITQAQAQINIAHGDTATPNLPQQDIDALVELEGAKVRYLPDHPEVTALKGKVHIDGKSLDAKLDSGRYMKDTKLSDGRVLIEDLIPDNPYIKVTLSAESTAKDIVHLLELPRLKHAQKLNLSVDTAEGKVVGHAALGFNFFSPHDANGNSEEPKVDFDITTELAGVAQPGFMKKFDAKKVNGTLSVNNKELVFKGNGEVNGASVGESTVRYVFHSDQVFDTFLDVNATVPVESLPRFGYPAFEFLKGTLGVKASMKQGKSAEQTQANIDLTNASVNIQTLRVNKPDQEVSSIDLTSEKKDDTASIPDFHFKSKTIDAHGSVDLNKDLSGLRHVHLDKLVSGANTKLDRLDYVNNNNAFTLDMHGSSFDISPWMGSKDDKEESTFSFEHFPAVQFKTDIAHLFFGEGRELRDIKGTLNCDMVRCESADIKGITPDTKPFNFLILRNPKGRRQLSLHAQSAGAFLHSVNMFDGMEGGDLTVTGNYTEATATTSSILRGHVDINEHTVKNAPILAKIVSLASLTGIFDTLGGKGIHFDRLSVPFTLSKDVITLEKAKTHGDALGMTADGTITFPKGTLDLQGTIVPSYSLNHVLGNVPLIGTVLTGGDGQGVFAARYSVKGTQKDPQVSVNPLSILTPGFLRGLFDILDSRKKQEDDDSQ